MVEKRGGIEANRVTKIFSGTKEDVIALNKVDLNIEAGAFVSLVGPSGCGKTTLLRLIAGLENPTNGKIYLDKEEIKGTSYERGLVFQSAKLFPWMTIHENIAFGLKARKVYSEKENQVGEFIDLVGLNGFENSYPHHLSGGMQQRVSLARALINHPKVLLMDEPLGALDALTRVNMQDEIIKIWKLRNTTMVMVTHDVEEAIYLSDKIIVMTPRPAKIECVVDVKLDRPRNRDRKEFIDLKNDILKILDFKGID